MDYLRLLIPAFIACCCNALANMFWKFEFSRNPLNICSLADIIQLLFSWKILVGIGFYGCSMLLFFYMLSNFKLSAIMPVTCITYILNILIAVFVFCEDISWQQIMGTFIVILGLLILSRGPVT